MAEYCLVLTYKCDWHCTYCISDTHSPHKELISLDDIKSRLTVVEEGDEVSLSGGEPGLAHPKIVSYVMDKLIELNCIININTNGLFLKRYSEYYDSISNYFYHCSEYLEDIKYFPDDPDNKVEYMITVDDERYDMVEGFLDKYSNIQFAVFGADKPYSSLPNRTSLNKISAIRLLHKFKDRINPNYLNYLYSTCQIENESTLI
jgi:organic radical activating enzyme